MRRCSIEERDLVIEDARDLMLLGRSLRERNAALEGTVLHSLGGVLDHRGFRARVHAGLTVILVGTAVLLTVQRRRRCAPASDEAHVTHESAACIEAKADVVARLVEREGGEARDGGDPLVERVMRGICESVVEGWVAAEDEAEGASCPCGSGKKYKRCCSANAGSLPKPDAASGGVRWVIEDDGLDDLSNSVMALIRERHFDDVLAACKRLLDEFPEVGDGLERSDEVHEAMGNHALAADFYRRAHAFVCDPIRRADYDDELIDDWSSRPRSRSVSMLKAIVCHPLIKNVRSDTSDRRCTGREHDRIVRAEIERYRRIEMQAVGAARHHELESERSRRQQPFDLDDPLAACGDRRRMRCRSPLPGRRRAPPSPSS